MCRPWRRAGLLAQELRREPLCFRNALDFKRNGVDRLLEASESSVTQRSCRLVRQLRFVAASRDPSPSDGVYRKCKGSKGPE